MKQNGLDWRQQGQKGVEFVGVEMSADDVQSVMSDEYASYFQMLCVIEFGVAIIVYDDGRASE